MISREDIEAAARRIATHIRQTPCIELEAGAFGVNASLVLKLETLQRIGFSNALFASHQSIAKRGASSIAIDGGPNWVKIPIMRGWFGPFMRLRQRISHRFGCLRERRPSAILGSIANQCRLRNQAAWKR